MKKKHVMIFLSVCSLTFLSVCIFKAYKSLEEIDKNYN